jgi:hypothetical protein
MYIKAKNSRIFAILLIAASAYAACAVDIFGIKK